jgi:hypothetical protein
LSLAGVRVVRHSALYETAPAYVTDPALYIETYIEADPC